MLENGPHRIAPRSRRDRAVLRCARATLILALVLARAAWAQIGPVQLPSLPRLGIPAGVTGAVSDLTNDLGGSSISAARRLRVRELLRTQPALIERDPNGDPILRAQVVALSPSSEALDEARELGFAVVREQTLEGLDTHIVVLQAPEGWATRRALNRMRALDSAGRYDFNHIYFDSGADAAAQATGPPPRQAQEQEPSSTSVPRAPSDIRIGLVDGGIDVSHAVFRDALIHQHGCGDKPIVSTHGTAVASLLIGKSTVFSGAAPNAQLFAADVYCGLPTGGAVDAVIEAIAWITHEHVPVINVSLVGPTNVTLEGMVKTVLARGYIIVAAVGNDGPAAPALYPASYPGVVGVTAVDAHRRVLLEACRGSQVRFAAPGADMAAATLSDSYAAVRGTSFAAPIVAGLLAKTMRAPDAQMASEAIESLARHALDLGARGFDPVYGYGLVGEEVRTNPTPALLAKPVVTTH
jgi:hypothetical protein